MSEVSRLIDACSWRSTVLPHDEGGGASSRSGAVEGSEQADLFLRIVESAVDTLALIHQGRIVWMSPAFSATFGWSADEYVGRACKDFLHPDCQGEVHTQLLAVEAGEQSRIERRARMRDRSGHFHWVDVHAGRFRGGESEPHGVVAVIRVVDDLVAEERRLEEVAARDGLTGLLNRKEVLSLLTAISEHARHPGDLVAVAYCDIDGFKGVNDSHGHLTGDSVLRSVAQRIRTSVRQDDLVARLGGDEFLVILTGVHDLDEARAIADKVRVAIAAPLRCGGRDQEVTVSMGVTMLQSGDTIETLIERADRAMYEAKRSGRNRISVLG